jgi:hypothetical protein
MAEHETAAPWLLPYPDPTGKAKLGATNFKELAERLTAIFKERFLSIATHAASYTAVSGELGVQEKAGETTTLPAATTKDRIVGVFCKAASCKITTSGGAFIQGDFITIASKTATITLLEGQHVILQSDGTNWFIIAGEPKREQVYGARTARALATAFTPSTARPTLVVIDLSLEPTPGFGKNAKVYVNGGLVTELFAGGHTVESGYRMSTSFTVPAGQTWEVRDGTGSGGVGGLFSTYLTQ